METRASYMIVGVFTLLIIAGAFVFTLWTAKNSQGHMRAYEIVFTQSVAGLNIGSAVLLEGVRVGQVSSIKVSPQVPGRVIVHIQIAEDTPIREDSTASLEPQGITGLSSVAISGGTAESPLLAAEAGSVIPRIPSRPSQLQEIMNSVPAILGTLDHILGRASQFLNPENIKIVGGLLVSVSEIAETLAKNKESITRAVEGFGDAGQSFAASGKRLDTLVASAQSVVDKEMRGAARSVETAAAKLGDVASAAEPGMRRFSSGIVEELHNLFAESRRLVAVLTSLTRQLESDPRRFLFGNPIPEFSAP